MKLLLILSLFYSFNSLASGGSSGGGGSGSGSGDGILPYVLGDRSCGQLDQPKCRVWVKEYWDMVNTGCDRGLAKRWNWSKWQYYCSPGTRYNNRPIPYIAGSHKFQRELVRSKPLTQMASLAAHNSIGYTRAGTTFISNQYFSPTDLLNMGLRFLALDVHYTNGNLRVIHCERSIPITCKKNGRYWAAYLEELKIWMDKNPSEIIILYIEDYLERDRNSFAYPIEKIIGANKVYTRQDRNSYGSNFPSMDWLRQRGKQLIIFNQNNSGHNFTHSQYSSFYPRWPRAYVKYFKASQCRVGGRKISGRDGESSKNYTWYQFMEIDGRLMGADFSIVYDPTKDSGRVTLQSIRDATKCGLNYMEMDWVTNAKAEAAIWSWGTGEPRSWGKGRNCTRQRNGRWYSNPCSEKKYHACRQKNNRWVWRVTNKTGIFIEGPTNCESQFGSNFYFALPLTGDENEALRVVAGSNKDVWMNFSTGINWSTVKAQLAAAKSPPTGVSNGTYQIRPQISYKYLTAVGSSNIQYSYLGKTRSKDMQEWILEKQGDGHFIIKNKRSNKCMDSFSDGNNGRIGLWSCHKGDNQRWKLINKGLNTYQLQNKRSRRCMDINGSKRHNWNSTMNWTCYNVRQHYYTLIKQ